MNSRRIKSISPSDPRALEKVIEALEVSEGIRGNSDDRKPTIAEVKTMMGSDLLSGFGTPPLLPRNVRVTENKHYIAIEWLSPKFKGYISTDIYRSETTDVSESVQVGSTSSNWFIDFFADAEKEYYYFIRHRGGTSSSNLPGPYTSPILGMRKITPAKPTVITGYLDQNNKFRLVNIGFVEPNRKVRITVHGNFWVRKRYDFDLETLVISGGNSYSVKVSRSSDEQVGYYNDNWEETVYPTVAQTSLEGPYGQRAYGYLLNRELIEIPAKGEAKYLIEALPHIPNPGAFQLFYTIELI